MTDPVVATRPPVSALLLGYAGLLPPIVGIAMRLADPSSGAVPLGLSLFYAALILSFLGGMWWGAVATRVNGGALGLWLGIAVLPSLIALAAGALTASAVPFNSVMSAAAIVAAALLGSLLVDMALVRAGHVPPWWMKLRVPLSVGLAVLTLVVGLLAAG